MSAALQGLSTNIARGHRAANKAGLNSQDSTQEYHDPVLLGDLQDGPAVASIFFMPCLLACKGVRVASATRPTVARAA